MGATLTAERFRHCKRIARGVPEDKVSSSVSTPLTIFTHLYFHKWDGLLEVSLECLNFIWSSTASPRKSIESSNLVVSSR